MQAAGHGATKGGEQERDATKDAASPADDPLSLLRSWALMPELLAMYTDRPVVDRSGFAAPAYCTSDGNDPLFTLISQLPPGGGRGGEVQPRDVNVDFGANSIFTVIEEKWGMKLEPQKAPVDMIVIDHVERPSEN
jgi:uncharacterized protein (TIGR03435 family)